jgi:hypothetical protein
MPRQNLGDVFPDLNFTGIVPVSQGGTGANTRTGAIQNLGGIEKGDPLIDKLKYLFIDSDGYIANISDLVDSTSSVITISGPLQVYKQDTVRYYITSADTSTTYNVSVTNANVSLGSKTVETSVNPRLGATVEHQSASLRVNEGTFSFFLTPTIETGTITLNINGRIFNILVTSNQLNTPIFKEVTVNNTLVDCNLDNNFYSRSIYSQVYPVLTNQTLTIPENVSHILLYGRLNSTGIVNVVRSGKTTRTSEEIIITNGSAATTSFTDVAIMPLITGTQGTCTIDVRKLTSIQIGLINDGALHYQWKYEYLTHTSTDWQFATSPAFEPSSIVHQSMDDTVNLYRYSTNLPYGDYYIRARFNGTTVESIYDLAPSIATPSIVLPANNAVVDQPVEIQSSAYAEQSGLFEHAESIFKLSRNSAMTDAFEVSVSTAGGDSILTKLIVDELGFGVTWYVTVQYKGTEIEI